MAENQQAHRMELESKHLTKNSNESSRGQIFAFILSLLLILSGSYLIYLNHDTAGTTIITGTVIGLATVFIWGRKEQQKGN